MCALVCVCSLICVLVPYIFCSRTIAHRARVLSVPDFE